MFIQYETFILYTLARGQASELETKRQWVNLNMELWIIILTPH